MGALVSSSQIVPDAPSPDAQGHRFLTMVCTRICRGISAPAPGAPPPILLHWPYCLQGFFSPILTHLLWLLLHRLSFPISSTSSQRCHHHCCLAQPWPLRDSLGALWHWLCQTRGKFLVLLTETTPLAPLLPKLYQVNSI